MNVRTIIAIVALSASIMFSISLVADDEAAPDGNEFKDKVVIVYQNTESKHPSHIVVDSSLQVIGGRVFLVGKGADTNRKKDWRSGMKTGIAWDSVTTYNVLTPKEYNQYLLGDVEVINRPGEIKTHQ